MIELERCEKMIKKLKDNEDYSYLLLLKLMLVSIVIGLLIGFVDTVFGRVLLFLSDFEQNISTILSHFRNYWAFNCFSLSKGR